MHTPSVPFSANWAGRDAESLLWLASYPRSGNTFTRLLLANYFRTGDQPYDINALADFCPADTSAALWRSYAAAFAAPRTVRETWEARAGFFAHYRKTRDPGLFPGIKTHTGNIRVHGVEGFDVRPNDRALYIVRHPLDVVVSFADYNGKDIGSAIDELRVAGAYVRHDWIGALEVRGSWAEHVANWVLAPPCELLLIHYEALCADTATTLRTILDFLGAPIVEKKVTQAVDASRFETVRAQETANGFREAPGVSASGRFFREGRHLQWLRTLSPDQAYHLADSCGETMRRVGYTHPRDVFFDGRNALGPPAL